MNTHSLIDIIKFKKSISKLIEYKGNLEKDWMNGICCMTCEYIITSHLLWELTDKNGYLSLDDYDKLTSERIFLLIMFDTISAEDLCDIANGFTE